MFQINKFVLAILLTFTTVTSTSAHAGKISDMISRTYTRCRDFLSRRPPTPRTFINKLVRIANLPSGFAQIGQRPGLAKVIEETGDLLTVEYINERTQLTEVTTVPKESVELPWDLREIYYAMQLKQAHQLAYTPDLSLTDRVVALPQFELGLVHVISATRAQLMIEVIDPDTFSVQRMNITRPEGDLTEVSASQRKDYLELLKVTQALAKNPAIREGKVLMWKPLTTTTHATFTEDEFREHRIFRQQIIFNFAQSFPLPDIPEIRVPLIYRGQAIALRIDQIILDQGIMNVSGAGWSGVMRLSADLFSRSEFYQEDLALFRLMPEKGFEAFAEFRKRFRNLTLNVGDAVILWAAEGAIDAPKESGIPVAYQIIYADKDRVIIKRPGQVLELSAAGDLGRLTMSSTVSGQSAAQMFAAQNPDATSMVADGEFKPTTEQVNTGNFKFLREMPSIRAELLAMGMPAAAIEHYARRITDPKPVKGLNFFYRTSEEIKQDNPPAVIPIQISGLLEKWTALKNFITRSEPEFKPVDKPAKMTLDAEKARVKSLWKVLQKFAHSDRVRQLGVSQATEDFLTEVFKLGSAVSRSQGPQQDMHRD